MVKKSLPNFIENFTFLISVLFWYQKLAALYFRFDNVRIPRENILNSVADVSSDGKYLSSIKDPDQVWFSFYLSLQKTEFLVSGNSLMSLFYVNCFSLMPNGNMYFWKTCNVLSLDFSFKGSFILFLILRNLRILSRWTMMNSLIDITEFH